MKRLFFRFKVFWTSYWVVGVCFILNALFECAHTLTVATFIAFQLCSFITLSSAERTALHESVQIILHLSTG